jgi:hypothetical protein
VTTSFPIRSRILVLPFSRRILSFMPGNPFDEELSSPGLDPLGFSGMADRAFAVKALNAGDSLSTQS